MRTSARYDGVADWYDPGPVREATRVLCPRAPFAYLGVHPCFIGPHSRFLAVQAFLDAGFRIERFEEPASPGRDYPHLVALRCRR